MAWLDKYQNPHEYIKYGDIGTSDVRHTIARVRGAAHPVCFTDKVMEHYLPSGFKPVNIEEYDGSTDPYV